MSVESFGPGQEAIDPRLQDVQDDILNDDGEHISILRNYEKAPLRVQWFYRDNHTYHTYEATNALWQAYASPEARTLQAPMWEMLMAVGKLYDESDPDVEHPQIFHAMQCAEAARRAGEPREMQATVLVHDVGKVLAADILPGRDPLPQWAVVGDTFPVGLKFDKRIVYPEYFYPQGPDQDSENPVLQQGWPGNPDVNHPIYGTDLGVYTPGIGLDKVKVSFGHDEYLYQVLKQGSKLPDWALNSIRYHSLYPVHNAGAYDVLLTDEDRHTLEVVRHFNQYDLYSKAEELPNIEELTPYYQELVDEFFPEPLHW